MALFRVTQILSGNKIRVVGWNWGSSTGTDVVIAGYSPIKGTPDMLTINENLAKNRLTSLIQDKDVELGRVIKLNEDNSLTCLVFYNGVDIAKYFPEYMQTPI